MKKTVTLAVLMLALWACGPDSAPTEELLRPVRFITIDNGTDLRTRSYSGVSKSQQESRLSFKVAGTVVSVPVQVGEPLARGDLIAEIDPASYSLQMQQAQATLLEAQANDRRSAANYDRTKGLYANDNASLSDLDAARAQAESSRAVVASASKALEIARLNLSYTKLRAATDCSIASLDIEVNENVSSGQQIASVSCGTKYEVNLSLPESLIGGVTAGTAVEVRFDAIENEVFAGTVDEVAVALSQGSAAFPVVVRITGSHPSLRSGLAADVTFQFGNGDTGTVVLPVSVVAEDAAGTFVFVAEASDASGEAVVRRREVSLGELSQDGIEVIDGLDVGERVITAGISIVRDGQRVLIRSDK